MKFLVLLAFVAIPLAEIAVFIKVGEFIGIVATVALVILTAVIGVALLKQQGLIAFERARRSIDAGELPIESVIEGVCLLVAGAFLLTPGLITDTVGFLLLVPALRQGFAAWLLAKAREAGSLHVWTGRPAQDRDRGRPPPDGVIEGEYEEVEPASPPAKPPKTGDGTQSPWRK